MLTNVDTPRVRWNPLRGIPLPLVGGIIFGSILTYIWFQLESKWIFYIFLGTLGLAALPIIAILIRGLDRFFLSAFILSQQMHLSFNLIVDDKTMPGGVQGINITLQFLVAMIYFFTWSTRENPDPKDVRSINPRFLRACVWFLVLASFSFINTTTKSYVADDPDQYAESIHRLMRDDGLYARLTAAAHDYVQRSHAWPTLLTQYRERIEAAASAQDRVAAA